MNNNKVDNNSTSIYELEKKLSDLIKKKKEIKLRTQANIENIKKKSEQTIQKIQKENLTNFKKELIYIVEKLNKISEISDKQSLQPNSIIEGIELIQKCLLNTIKKIK
ncbi:Protein GrpE [Buchnera aphidicola (Takecallis arundicolens)]|uniref:nucleotide exchange factor GrpE n=1 Tax=Buchnera aphidicola TaxID=9 RepID=UPI003463DD98